MGGNAMARLDLLDGFDFSGATQTRARLRVVEPKSVEAQPEQQQAQSVEEEPANSQQS